MIVGCVKEIKKSEFRVGMTPDNAKEYVSHGHEVLIEAGAGLGSSFSDEAYKASGAEILSTADEVWERSEMIVKVKEPLEEEYPKMRPSQIAFTYLHLAADRTLTQALLERKVSGVAYETIRGNDGGLPLLKPMSEIAGRLSIQAGAKCLEKPNGGRGVLLGGVSGVERGKVTIVGAGTVGLNAAKMAMGLGAEVVILDRDLNRLSYIDDLYGSKIQTLYSSESNLEKAIIAADLVIGSVLIPGASAPKLIKRSYLSKMKVGSVIVDVAVDQGGCAETTHPTYHDDPTYVVDGVIHYCVANMPGAVSLTSTLALTNATLPYGLLIADLGLEAAISKNAGLKQGLNTFDGKVTLREISAEFGLEYTQV